MAKVHLKMVIEVLGKKHLVSACGKFRKDYDIDLSYDVRAVTCKACLRSTMAAVQRIKRQTPRI